MKKTFVLCKKTFTIAKKKDNVFGKSALDIHSLVKHATKAVYLSVCVDCKNLQSVAQSAIIDYNAIKKHPT